MTGMMRMGWSEAFWLVKAAQPFVSSSVLNTQIPLQIRFFNTIINNTEQAIRTAVLQQINQVLSKTWTPDAFNNMLAQAAASVAPCAQCNAGFQNSTNASNSTPPCQKCPPHC